MQLLPHRAAVWLLISAQSSRVHSSFRIISASISLTRGRLFKDLGQHGNVKCIKKKNQTKCSSSHHCLVCSCEDRFFFPCFFHFIVRKAGYSAEAWFWSPGQNIPLCCYFCHAAKKTRPLRALTGLQLRFWQALVLAGMKETTLGHPPELNKMARRGRKKKNTERGLAGIIRKTSLFRASEGLQHVNSSQMNVKLPDTHRTMSFEAAGAEK